MEIDTPDCIKTLYGHIGGVCCLVKSVINDEQTLASSSWDKNIKLWNIQDNYNCASTLLGHKSWVLCMTKISDSPLLISGSNDKTLIIWDIELKTNIKTLYGHTEGIHTVIEVDNARVVSGSADTTIKIWNLLNFTCTKIDNLNSHFVNCLIKLNSKNVASGSNDNQLEFGLFSNILKDGICYYIIIF